MIGKLVTCIFISFIQNGDIDLFADANNHKLEKNYSAYWCPGTSGVDAFAFDW